MNNLKHIGRITNTNKKCIVAYRTIPGDAYNCLVIPTESLIDIFHDALINTVESNAGQSANEFAEVLARNSFPDGSNMLAALHTQGKLIKVPTDRVEMLPRPGIVISLAELNQVIAQQLGIAVDELSLKSNVSDIPTPTEDVIQKQKPNDSVSKTTSESINQPEDSKNEFILTPAEQVQLYLDKANLLFAEAANLKKLAEALIPESTSESTSESTVAAIPKTIKPIPKSTNKQSPKGTQKQPVVNKPTPAVEKL